MRLSRPFFPVRCAAFTAAALLLAAAAHAVPNNRLDPGVRPTFQSLRLQLDPSRPDYSGATRIEFRVAAASESFALYAQDLDVIRVVLRDAAGTEIGAETTAGQAGLLTVKPARALAPGDYTLDLDFTNDFDMRSNSLYRVKSGEDWYAYTQFEAVAARAAFPCWDEPEFKIPFQLTLTVPEAMTALSNTPVEKESTVGGQRTTVFKRTPPMPTYLVALAVGPFDLVPIPGLPVPGNVVTVRGSGRLAAEAVRITPRLLAACERYFGSRYPYEKLDLVAVPEFAAGAMENPGLVTYRDSGILLDPETASVRQRYSLASTTAHELAHMWFGDLVTMAWWDDLWLNEAFASWMGDKIAHEVFPEFNVPVRDLAGTFSAMQTDARLSTRAVRKSVDAFDNLDRLFDGIAYQKGQAVLGMIESWLGPEVFRRGVLDYLKRHEWGNATAADLWAALSKASGQDVTPVTRSFLDQEGVPLVTVALEGQGRVRLTQRRFLAAGVEAPRPTLWRIPVVLRYSDGRQTHTQRVLLAEAEQTVRLERGGEPVWLHPNADEGGYYRWALAAGPLQALAAAAPAALTGRERVGFVRNLAALLDGGTVGGDDYLRTLEAFASDPQPEVLEAVLGGLAKVRETFISPALEASYTVYARKLLRPALDRVGLARARGEPEPVTLMRPNLLWTADVHARDRRVLDWARAEARRYLSAPDSVEPSLAGAALGLAARGGDLALFETIRQRFEKAATPTERSRFLATLGDFRDAEVIDKALTYAVIGPMRPHEVLTIPRTIAETEELKDLVWRWFRSNYDRIASRVPPSYLARLPLFADCCQPQRVEDARTFFGFPAHSPPGTRDELAKVIDRIQECSRLREREGATVATYLTRTAQSR